MLHPRQPSVICIFQKENNLRNIFISRAAKNENYFTFSYSYNNSKITPAGRKDVITKDIAGKISEEFCLYVMHVKRRGGGEKGHEVERNMYT